MIYLAPLFWLGLRLAGLQRLQAWLDRFPIARLAPLSQAEAAALGVAVNRVVSHVLGLATCLMRSLLLRWMLRRSGTTGDLRNGVRFEEGGFLAHAWVGKDDIPIYDSHDAVACYVAFDQPVSPEIFR